MNKTVLYLSLLVSVAMQTVEAMGGKLTGAAAVEENKIYIKNESPAIIEIAIDGVYSQPGFPRRADQLKILKVLQKDERQSPHLLPNHFAPNSIAVSSFAPDHSNLNVSITSKDTKKIHKFWVNNASGKIELTWTGEKLQSSNPGKHSYRILK